MPSEHSHPSDPSPFNDGLSHLSASREPASHFDSDSDYGYDSPRNGAAGSNHHPRLATQKREEKELLSVSDSSSESAERETPRSNDSDDSDDMPLAQRIPTALQAQKTLRKQSREQRNKHQQGRKTDVKALPVRLRSSDSRPSPGVVAGDLTRRLLEVQSDVIHHSDDRRGSPSAHSITGDTKLAFPTDRPQEEPHNQQKVRRTLETTQQVLVAGSRTRLRSEHKYANDVPARARTLTERGSPAYGENRRKMGTMSGPHTSQHHIVYTSSIPLPDHRPPIERQIAPEINPPTKSNPQRIYITDSQRFSTVSVDATTRAKDILDKVAGEGLLPAGDMSGSLWMLWELDQDFGMERPVREFELASEIINSWGPSPMNRFMLRPTQLASALARSAIPSSSPTCTGYVEWEQRPGKWSKRWLDIRESGLWVSKRHDNTKDAVHVCSLSNFDVYRVARIHKSPKPFVFCLKSTDNITLFENPADHVHIFSCDMARGMQWVQHIMVARSYVLLHERTTLFRDYTEPLVKKSKPLSRSNTKRAPQPRTLVDMDKILPRPFAPGSLLATAKSLPFDAQ